MKKTCLENISIKISNINRIKKYNFLYMQCTINKQVLVFLNSSPDQHCPKLLFRKNPRDMILDAETGFSL